MTIKKLKNISFIIIAIVTVLYAAIVPFTRYQPVIDASEIKGVATSLPIEPDTEPTKLDEATPFDAQAEAMLAFDLDSKAILFEKNSTSTWPTASLAKMMTALVTLNLLDYDDVVTIEETDIKVPAPRMGLVAGEQISVLSLLSGMLISSANDAAYALSRAATGSKAQFVGLMNESAKKLGLTNTKFSDAAGFDGIDQYTTALDTLSLALVFIEEPELARIVKTKSARVQAVDGSRNHYLTTTNKLLLDGKAIGVKTGFTEQALGNLVALFDNSSGTKILVVTLGSEDREGDSLRLSQWVYNSYDFKMTTHN